MISKEQILAKLQKHWNHAVEAGYNPDRFLGIFLYGSQNYHMANENSDIDSKIIVIPTFEEFCLNKNWVSKELRSDEDEHIEVKDIRYMREMWQKQNVNYLELLYTEYFIINPKYEQLFNHYFVNNREVIAHYDRNKAVKSIGGQLLHTLGQGRDDNKKLYNSFRLHHFLQNYLLGMPYEDCIVPKGNTHDFLWELKYNCKWDAATMLERADDLEHEVEHLMAANSNLDSPDFEAAAAALDTGVCEILKFSFEEKSLSKEDFLKNLTNTETKALHSIFNEIHAEGNISLSKMIEKYSISRPVYNNLLSKLKEYNIAEVVSQGMKGTYIKFTQSEIKTEAIDFV